MAVCPTCEQEMKENLSCLPDPIKIGDRLFDPIRWSAERESQGRGRRVDLPCRDCGCPPGGVHHPGCCVECCPACLGQALGCPCFGLDDDDYDEDDSDDDYGDGPYDEPAAATTWTPPVTASEPWEGHRIPPPARCTAHLLPRHYRT
jgi:hypothetical protein